MHYSDFNYNEHHAVDAAKERALLEARRARLEQAEYLRQRRDAMRLFLGYCLVLGLIFLTLGIFCKEQK